MRHNNEISKGIDWATVWLYIGLTTIGVISIFAATYRNENVFQGFISLKTDYGRQTLYLLISIILGIFILLTDSKFFTATANIGYIFGMVLLLLVFPFHTEVKGTKSIIRFASFQLQPAELCKIFVNLALAKYLSRVETDFTRLPALGSCQVLQGEAGAGGRGGSGKFSFLHAAQIGMQEGFVRGCVSEARDTAQQGEAGRW